MNFPCSKTALVGRRATTPFGYVTVTFWSDNMSNLAAVFAVAEQTRSLFVRFDYQASMTWG